jgi:DNA-binding CsgD family transcriptional regulator
MPGRSQPAKIASFSLIGIGLALLALNLFTRGAMNVALPLVFLVLGGIFFILAFNLRHTISWSPFLFIPAMLSSAFGIIFLLNVLTQDWNSWAYAWLLLLAALGLGILLTNRNTPLPPVLSIIGWVMTLAGLSLFCLFGAISGGRFIQVIAPILLVAAGLSLRWFNFDRLLKSLASKKAPLPSTLRSSPVNLDLVEPLSSRELEVLKLIIQGFSNQQIADQLTIAPSTIKTHINNIYSKLGVQTRIQAINRARALNIIPG